MLNSVYRPLVDGGYILAASAASNLVVQRAVELSITDTKLWLGLSVPHWVGWVAFIAALFFGATISLHQETAVDKYIKHPRLKPYYSFGFGFFVFYAAEGNHLREVPMGTHVGVKRIRESRFFTTNQISLESKRHHDRVKRILTSRNPETGSN